MAGCANSGPQQIGKDTYTVSTRVTFKGPAGARGEALQTANKFCHDQHKEVMLESEDSGGCMLRGGCAEAQVTFMCLASDDPRFKEHP